MSFKTLKTRDQWELDYLDTELQSRGTLISATQDWAWVPRESTTFPEVVWITPLTTFNRMDSNYVRYGNEASMGYLYGDVCLIVKVGKPWKPSCLMLFRDYIYLPSLGFSDFIFLSFFQYISSMWLHGVNLKYVYSF
ncbi:hypothetical protein F5146DRAFT_1144963 [Armillaria mellea]|nr:hypothetical protein F5146DRAFT_1144963 [Armillaria mellea]